MSEPAKNVFQLGLTIEQHSDRLDIAVEGPRYKGRKSLDISLAQASRYRYLADDIGRLSARVLIAHVDQRRADEKAKLVKLATEIDDLFLFRALADK